ncbi:leucine-rich repeat-containing protein 46 isoform X2 [Carettochelys insculpta]|uniref:leucine-rich repeat-containing protein 46 isoform X2 n=1 Tax=Carettochelys insculpta TaxID=44489 RepID=UPI003EBA02E5
MLGGLRQSPAGEAGSITDCLVAQRNLRCPAEKGTPESTAKALASLLTVRLDRENICTINNLQGLREVRSLYLQQARSYFGFEVKSDPFLWQVVSRERCVLRKDKGSKEGRNQIETIENLSCLPNLRFLSLAGNRIRALENLQDLKQLQFLDLSQNQIKTLDPDELPQSLLILNLLGNGCTNQAGYRELVLGALPRLKMLDAQLISSWRDPYPAEEEEEAGASEDSASEEDDDIPELTGPFCTDKEFFVGLHQELAGRSQRRRQEALREHQARLEELAERQRLMQLPGSLCPGRQEGRLAPSPVEEGATGGRSPAPRLCQPHPTPNSGSRLLPLRKAGGSTRSGTFPSPGQSKCGSGAGLKAPKGAAPTAAKTAAKAAKK